MGENAENGKHRTISLKKGLDLGVAGAPEQKVVDTPAIGRVALLGKDYPGLKPSFKVKEGSKVKVGDLLFTDMANPGVNYTSPGTGKVVAINRGERRAFVSIEIELSGKGEKTFKKYTPAKIKSLKKKEVEENLLESGLWTSLKTRPFGYVADRENPPFAIFVTSVDSNPHAPDPAVWINEKKTEYTTGIEVLSRLTEGELFVVRRKGSQIPNSFSAKSVVDVEVEGPHPSGNPGTHIHFLAPVNEHRHVWYINYQDVIAVGHLFLTGSILLERVVSVAGPAVASPALVKTRSGASTSEITAGRLVGNDIRVVSGSLLSGHTASGAQGYLGKYHNQVSALSEGNKREFLGWMSPGLNRYSFKNIYLSRLFGKKIFSFNTAVNGAPRAMVPSGMFEKVMPMDIVATFLLRAILVGDIEYAEKLGVLELEEEDLALCSFVSTGKDNFGEDLRKMLTRIKKEG